MVTVEVVTMIGAGATHEETEAVSAVMRREGLGGPCKAVVGGQGDGISIIIVETTVSTFLSVFLTPAAESARDCIKSFFRDSHDARNDGDAPIRQTYVRPSVVTAEQWKRTKPHGRMPGWSREDSNEPELLLTDSMPDEAWDALFDLDFDRLPGGTYSWNRRARAWQRSEYS